MSIKRYDPTPGGTDEFTETMTEVPDGGWVSHADHIAALEAVKADLVAASRDRDNYYTVAIDALNSLEAVKAVTADELLAIYEAQTKKLPAQHEHPTRGCSTYNWQMSVIADLRKILSVIVPSPALESNHHEPVGYIMGEHLTRRAEVEANGTVMYLQPAGMATTPVYLHPPALEARTKFLATEDGEFNGNVHDDQQVIETLRAERVTEVNSWIVRWADADAIVTTLRAALEWYANPEIYEHHPHGSAFDKRDLSYVARAALTPPTQDEEAGK